MKASSIPIFTSRGDAAAFLSYPYIFNRQGEWIGWVTADQEVYSVLGRYVGYLTNEPRILRRDSIAEEKSLLPVPPRPAPFLPPAAVPLPPMMKELYQGIIDVLLDENKFLHTIDSGELRNDLD
jgi:hypothetical protein